MPTRLIREGIIASDRVNELDWPAEVFYRRLLNKVDDHGLYDARPSILRASLYPLALDRVREADVQRWIAACVKAGLIRLYEAEGKPYLLVLDTRWQVRSEAKYPLPPENISKQVLSPVQVDEDVVVDVVEVESVGKTLAPDATRPPPKVNGHGILFDTKNGLFIGITEEQELRWQEAYPAVPIPPAIAQAAAWAKANPANRKSNWERFLVAWFKREQDKAARVRR